MGELPSLDEPDGIWGRGISLKSSHGSKQGNASFWVEEDHRLPYSQIAILILWTSHTKEILPNIRNNSGRKRKGKKKIRVPFKTCSVCQATKIGPSSKIQFVLKRMSS
ncbi:hypothetical protein QJS10_CPB20g00817 [Acorus calamus]|uniref:Uncharacterized protein n=1 Tax=Acorus calamus TaxID=4465 RepID=A0AAV9CAT9_ACOCL|nr:hypothetical protein QJS10_CPB20g00817 [Acorus calamus]